MNKNIYLSKIHIQIQLHIFIINTRYSKYIQLNAYSSFLILGSILSFMATDIYSQKNLRHQYLYFGLALGVALMILALLEIYFWLCIFSFYGELKSKSCDIFTWKTNKYIDWKSRGFIWCLINSDCTLSRWKRAIWEGHHQWKWK